MNRILYVLAVAIFFTTSALATIIRVPADQPTIQAAINAAANGDTVLVADGTYYENINFKGKAITVASYYLMDSDTTHINNTIIDGSKPSHADSGSVVFFISGEDTTSVLSGFTITGGTGTETTEDANNIITPCRAGGGIFCNNGFAKIVHNKIINNTVISNDKEVLGGGIIALPFNSNAWLVLRNNQISRNMIKTTTGAAVGGGLEIGSNAILSNNLISFNSVVHNATESQAGGGGFDCSTYSSEHRTIIAEFNTIIHNSITSQSKNVPSAFGSGVSLWGRYRGRFSTNEVSNNEMWVNPDGDGIGIGVLLGEITDSFVFERNVIRENAVEQGRGWGGGVNISTGAYPTLLNNIIAGNSATNGGGILIVRNSNVKLINNTVVNNKATTGGGIYLTESSTVYLMNAIIWANQAPVSPSIRIVSGTVKAAYCDIEGGWSGAGNIDADPLLVADTLTNASPCIGAGMDVHDFGNGVVLSCPPHDINGSSRPFPARSRPDMGAYESILGPTAVESQPSAEIPQAYALHQNHPNPFNPSTTIAFALPKASFVTLKIYDLLGKEVATLVADKLPAGKHQRVWEAKGLASGVYLYRLEAALRQAQGPATSSGRGFVQTKKLILLQ